MSLPKARLPGFPQRLQGYSSNNSFSHSTFLLFLVHYSLHFSPPSNHSLFKVQVLSGGGDSSNTDDLSSGSSQTASRPQTFLRQVAMATVPPPSQPPRATVSQAAPPFPPQPPFSLPPLGSSAASGRPPQQAPHAELQDKGTKRAFVPPMTPQPLRIQGAVLLSHSHRQVLSSVCDWFAKYHSSSNVLHLTSMPMPYMLYA